MNPAWGPLPPGWIRHVTEVTWRILLPYTYFGIGKLYWRLGIYLTWPRLSNLATVRLRFGRPRDLSHVTNITYILNALFRDWIIDYLNDWIIYYLNALFELLIILMHYLNDWIIDYFNACSRSNKILRNGKLIVRCLSFCNEFIRLSE